MIQRWDTLPELEAVRVFVAVAESASFRSAALALRVPRSTVSRRISSLESALKTRLLQRTTRRVTLTEAGDAFLKQVTPALAAIGEAGRTVMAAQVEPRGLVRITATQAMDELVGGILLGLVRRHPELRLELEFTDRRVDLIAEGFDLAVRSGSLPDSSFVARPIGVGQAGYYASPEYLKQRKRPKTPRDLRGHECIVFSGSSHGTRWRFRGRGKRDERVDISSRLVCNSLVLARRAALDGFGIAWMPEYMARGAVAEGRLVPVLVDHWPAPTPVQVLYPSSQHLAPQVRAALELLTAHLRKVHATEG
ncbi:MAG: LysR family transcriptional regulator [Labilithrix sp.]